MAIDPLQYLAANPDLIKAFGTDTNAALQHYQNYGLTEGRKTTFDAAMYEASNPDLISAFGSNTNAALLHYITTGVNENRATSSFDASSYLKANSDLSAAFGSDTGAAIQHYLSNGFNEHRSTSDASTLTPTSKTATSANSPPVVTGVDKSVASGKSITMSSLFKYSDANGDKATIFLVEDTGSGGGYITNNGVKQSSGIWISSYDVSTLAYVGGSSAGSEKILIDVFDGKDWSPTNATSTVTTTVASSGVSIQAGIDAYNNAINMHNVGVLFYGW